MIPMKIWGYANKNKNKLESVRGFHKSIFTFRKILLVYKNPPKLRWNLYCLEFRMQHNCSLLSSIQIDNINVPMWPHTSLLCQEPIS